MYKKLIHKKVRSYRLGNIMQISKRWKNLECRNGQLNVSMGSKIYPMQKHARSQLYDFKNRM